MISMGWEVIFIERLQSNLSGMIKVFSSIFSFIGGEKGLMILLVIVLFCWKKKEGQKLALIIASLYAWNSMIKSVVRRPRPYSAYPDRVEALEPANSEASATDVSAQGYSFPSMHSGAVVASYFTLARDVKKKWFWIFAAVLSLLVGFSRVATGNHYPTDVLAGWALGFVVIWVFDLLERHVRKEWVRYVILLAVTLPGLFFVRTNDYFTALGLLIGAIAAIRFERKFVDFQDTRNIPSRILRPVGAIVIYFVLNTLLKMPFSEGFLDSTDISALLVRTARYAIIIFMIMGIYPKVFSVFERKNRKEK